MRLSEAIRLGAAMKPQGFGNVYVGARNNQSCALEAAAESLGQRTYHSLEKLFPYLLTPQLCPVEHCEGPALSEKRLPRRFELVWHLNDQHRWSREQIANWIELNFEAPTSGDTVVSDEPVVKEDATAPAAQSKSYDSFGS